MQPLFSIIIPSYNRGHILPQAITSVLNQTYSNWELIIVDDGSTDNTSIVMNDFIDARINYIKKENGGVCSARNHGINFSSGEYVVFLDSDDFVSKDWLQHFYEKIDTDSNQDPDIICSGLERVNSKTNESVFVKPTDHGKGAIGWAVVIPGSYSVKKEFLIASGVFDEKITYGENTELFIRFRSKNPKLSYTNCFDLKYFPSEDGGSKNLINRIASNKIILEKHDGVLSTKTKFLFNQVIGVSYLKLGNKKEASKYFVRAIKYQPFQLKIYLRLITSKSDLFSLNKSK
jgi:glycosyltransferase involved in cell wall biosynthesis